MSWMSPWAARKTAAHPPSQQYEEASPRYASQRRPSIVDDYNDALLEREIANARKSRNWFFVMLGAAIAMVFAWPVVIVTAWAGACWLYHRSEAIHCRRLRAVPWD